MAKNIRRSTSAPGPNSPANTRVIWLLNHVWQGNRSKMAADIGVTHSVISKIAGGQQNAGRRLLGAIASHPKVSPAWLLTGQGEPLLVESPDAPTEGWPVPIFTQLLPGPPDRFRNLWSGEYFPLPGSLFRQSRYWLRVLGNDPVVGHPFAKVCPGDLLLLDTDPGWWKTEQMVDERICVVQLPEASGAKLGRVTFHPRTHEERGSFQAEMFDKQIDPSQVVRKTVFYEAPSGETRVETVPMRKTGGKNGGVKRLSQLMLAPITDEIGLKNIIAVCVLLVRR